MASVALLVALAAPLPLRAAPAVETCWTDPPPAVTNSHTSLGIKTEVTFSYVTCLAKATIYNLNTSPLDQIHLSLFYRTIPACDSGENGTRLIDWRGSLAPQSHKTISHYSNAGNCFRAMTSLADWVFDGAQVYAAIP